MKHINLFVGELKSHFMIIMVKNVIYDVNASYTLTLYFTVPMICNHNPMKEL
jgi:hypothetical protein